jgi:hypothetical protein
MPVESRRDRLRYPGQPRERQSPIH